MSDNCSRCVNNYSQICVRLCAEGSHYQPKPQTNADRIRSMTDYELAEWIYQVQDGDAYQKENYLPPLSKSWWLKWLKREAIT